jgi:hypothetical protein
MEAFCFSGLHWWRENRGIVSSDQPDSGRAVMNATTSKHGPAESAKAKKAASRGEFPEERGCVVSTWSFKESESCATSDDPI